MSDDNNRSESLADLKPLTMQPSDPMTNTTPNADDPDLLSFDVAVSESTFEEMRDSPYISVTDWSAMGSMSDSDFFVSFTVRPGDPNE